MSDSIGLGITGTLMIWGSSAILAIAAGLALAAGSLGRSQIVRALCRALINGGRCIPTGLLVIAAGICALRLPPPTIPSWLPGTLPVFQHVGWSIVLALALGSAGHLAEIFLAARATIGPERTDQLSVLGLSPLQRFQAAARECMAVALAPTGARLVHHLHNTAYGALFPITELFGVVLSEANSSFRVFYFTGLGCLIYIGLSALIWGGVRCLEAWLGPASRAAHGKGEVGS